MDAGAFRSVIMVLQKATVLKRHWNKKVVYINWLIYTVAGKKRGHSILGITLTNLATVLYFLAWIILILQRTKNIRKFSPTLQHRYVEMTMTSHTSYVSGHSTKAFQKENMTLQVKCWKNKWTESWLKVFQEKNLIKLVLFGSRRRPTWSRHHCSFHRGISTCVKSGVTHCKHWFWVKLALITFISTFTTDVDDSTICTNRFLAFWWNFVPFWCCCVMAGRVFHFARWSSNIN